MDFKDLKHQILKDSSVRKEFEKRDIAFEISKMIIEARIFRGFTQKKLAELMGKQQPSVARVESGNYLPSISYLEEIANALGTTLEIKFRGIPDSHTESRVVNLAPLASVNHSIYSILQLNSASGHEVEFAQLISA